MSCMGCVLFVVVAGSCIGCVLFVVLRCGHMLRLAICYLRIALLPVSSILKKLHMFLLVLLIVLFKSYVRIRF